jgi:hypothetical protein
MKWPPENGEGALAERQSHHHPDFSANSGANRNKSQEILCHRLCERPSRWTVLLWTEESFRLLQIFWRTGDTRHLWAFVRHVAAMRERILGGQQ